MSLIVGIDPGLSGAVAVVWNDDGTLQSVTDIPTMGTHKKRMVDGIALSILLESLVLPKAASMAERISTSPLGSFIGEVVLEQAQAMPRQGVSSTFRFGMAYGQIIGVLHSLRLPVTYVTSAKWKRSAGLDADKENSRRKAIETFPAMAGHFSRKKDHNRAEAALLARWHSGVDRR